MRIAILCNDRLGFPALQQILPSGLVVAAGTSNHQSETRMVLEQLCKHSNVPLQEFDRENFEAKLTEWITRHRPDVVLVKTFPFRIPASVLGIPKYGFINFHYAPLPEFRGPNPLFWMIRNRAPKGGVSVHKMSAEMDTGDILLQQEVFLSPDHTFGMFVGELAYAGAGLTMQLLNALQKNTLQPVPQDHEKAKWYSRTKPADLFIDWKTMDAADVRALVKACNPWNKGAAVRFKGWTFALTEVSLADVPVNENTPAGTIISLDAEKGCSIACKDGKAIRADIIYTQEGFFTGLQLSTFGLKAGDCLE
jgi:methionyl-tRNA formyltransferase